MKLWPSVKALIESNSGPGKRFKRRLRPPLPLFSEWKINNAFPSKIIAGSDHLHADIGRIIHKRIGSTDRVVNNGIGGIEVSFGFEINRASQ